MLHQRHNGKSICFAFQNPSGCSAGGTCIHQHICAHCFGPHSFDKCGVYSECSAHLKNRLDTVKRRFGSSAITSHAFQKKRHVGLPTCRTVLEANTSTLSKVESPCSSLKNEPVDCVGVQGGVGLPTPRPKCCVPLLEFSSFLVHAWRAVCSHAPRVSKTRVFSCLFRCSHLASAATDFSLSAEPCFDSKKCSPDELAVSELRSRGLTPHKKSTGFLATLSRGHKRNSSVGRSNFEGFVSVLWSRTRTKTSRRSFASSWVPSCANQRSGYYSSQPEHGSNNGHRQPKKFSLPFSNRDLIWWSSLCRQRACRERCSRTNLGLLR